MRESDKEKETCVFPCARVQEDLSQVLLRCPFFSLAELSDACVIVLTSACLESNLPTLPSNNILHSF